LASHLAPGSGAKNNAPEPITEMVYGPLSSFLDLVCIATFLPPAAIFPKRALSRDNFPFALNPLHQAPNPILLKPNRLLSMLI
jgi:hypothetical protein